jgi:hypothetical protein
MTAAMPLLEVHRFGAPTAADGPRLIILGAVHGNETCGTQAIRRILGELQAGTWAVTRGQLTLIPVTNPLAYSRGLRVGDRNLNRALIPREAPRDNEDRIANELCPLLAQHDVLVDLHSFRTGERAFVMRGPPDNVGPLEPFSHAAQETRLAEHVGPTRIVEGWLSAYADAAARRRTRGLLEDSDSVYGVGTTEYIRSRGGYGITVECGQHEDAGAPDVAYRAIRQSVALLGLADLPLEPPAPGFERLRLVAVIDREDPADRLAREWISFDPVAAGEPVGFRANGAPVLAPRDARVVFPDPAARVGYEWFYLAEAGG